MSKIVDFFLRPPDGLLWKLTEKFSMKSRRTKFALFMSLMKPTANDSILDVGIADTFDRGANFLEQWYPYPEKITALGYRGAGDFPTFKKLCPQVQVVLGNGKCLDFPDNAFDIVFSNAVVEHVGPTEEQRRFVSELCRVGKQIFITTPNYCFPIDSHTLLPLVHYLPVGLRYNTYRILGKEKWADINKLNLLTPAKLLNLFSQEVEVKLMYHGGIGRIFSHSLICFAKKSNLISSS